MGRPYHLRRLTKREHFDQRTMRYFIPRNRYSGRIRHNDTIKMADLSSRGIQPKRRTPGFLNLLWGKTYRDLQITQWRNGVQDGITTKYEIYASVPEWLRPWVETKLYGALPPMDESYRDMVRAFTRR